MHLNQVIYRIVSLLVALPASALKLVPIPMGQFAAASGLQRREFDQSLNFHPQPQAQLFYGLADGKEKVHLGNITLRAPPGLPIVLLERLDPLIEYVDCNRHDGQMALSFKSRNAFEQALKAWSFVNQNIEHKFLLITNHDGCSPREERQPNIVTEIREEAAFLTTHLTFHPVDFSDVSDNFELHWTQYKRRPSGHARARTRDVVESANDLTNNLMHPTGTNEPSDGSSGEGSDEPDYYRSPSDHPEGTENGEDPGKSFIEQMQDMWTKLRQKLWDLPKGISTNSPPQLSGIVDGANIPDNWVWDWTNRGTPLIVDVKTDAKKKFNFGSNIKGTIKAFCEGCVVEVSLLFTLKIAKVDGVVKAGSFTINVSNLKVSGTTSITRSGADLAQTVSNNDNIPLKLSAEKDIIGSPIPDYGLAIGDWVTLGFNWAYQLGLGVSFSGNFDLGVKYTAILDGDALMTIDLFENKDYLINADLLKYQKPEATIRKLEGPVTANIHGKLTIPFGVKVGKFKFEVAVFMPLPEIQVAMKAVFAPEGIAPEGIAPEDVCKTEGIKTGVIIESRYNIQIKTGGIYSIGGLDHTVGEQQLSPNWGKLLSRDCVAVDLPVISSDGDKSPVGTTPPGEPPPVPNAAPVPRNKDENKNKKSCGGVATQSDFCTVSTDDQQTTSPASSQSGDQILALQEGDQTAPVQPADPDQTTTQQPESQAPPQSPGDSFGLQPPKDATLSTQPVDQAASPTADDATVFLQPEGQAVSFPSAAAIAPSVPEDTTASLPQQDTSIFDSLDSPDPEAAGITRRNWADAPSRAHISVD